LDNLDNCKNFEQIIARCSKLHFDLSQIYSLYTAKITRKSSNVVQKRSTSTAIYQVLLWPKVWYVRSTLPIAHFVFTDLSSFCVFNFGCCH